MKKVTQHLRDELTQLHAYQVPDASGYIKLDAMENPYTWPHDLHQLWLQEIAQLNLNRYPDPAPKVLKEKLLKHFDPQIETDTLFGNGSDELIQLLILAIAKPEACVLTVSPSFSMYQIIAQMLGVKSVAVPLTESFDLDLAAMLANIEQYDPALIFLAYPNNPTGNLWSKEDILQIINAASGLVILDEAYGPFTEASFSTELSAYNNLLILRTASKLGLAGIRFGWLTGSPEWITQLNKLRLPYNINQLTQASLLFALDHFSIFAEQAQKIRTSRSDLFKRLTEFEEIEVFPSEANFILFKTKQDNTEAVFNNLLAQKVLIKNLHQQPGLQQCLRVTVGTDQENSAFLEALSQSLNS